jgi:predicted ATPase
MMQFPYLVGQEQRELLRREILGATRERMLREICEALEFFTADQPLILILEDLHLADESTLDLLSALARRRVAARLMLLAT